MNIYLVSNAQTPWGDWGEVLAYGMIAWDEDTDIDSIERTGPYTPPAYIRSGLLVLTEPTKEALENSGLKGISRFEHLEKSHIVELDWQQWDAAKGINVYLELDGEPESIIESRPHNPQLAARMPAFWCAYVAGKLALRMDESVKSNDPSHYLQVVRADERVDFFKANVHGGYFVSERAKNWLEQHCLGAFQFALIPPQSELDNYKQLPHKANKSSCGK